MPNAMWVRVKMASLTTVSGMLMIGGAGCSSSSSGNSAIADAGPPPVDSSVDATSDAGPTIPNPLISVYNGTENGTPPLRVCFALYVAGGLQPGIPPLPFNNQQNIPGTNYPGIPSGYAGPLPNATYQLGPTTAPIPIAASLPTASIYPYILNAANPLVASTVASNKGKAGYYDCPTLILTKGDAGTSGPDGGGLLVPNVDFWALPPIPAGTFQPGGSYVVAVTGCSNANNPALCGPPVAGSTSNFSLSIIQVDSTTPANQNALAAQAVQASTAIRYGGATDGGAIDAGLTLALISPDGGATYTIGTGLTLPAALPAGASSPVITSATPATALATANVNTLLSSGYQAVVLSGTTPITAVPLQSVMALSGMTDAGGYQFPVLSNGSAFTFIASHGVTPASPSAVPFVIAIPNEAPLGPVVAFP